MNAQALPIRTACMQHLLPVRSVGEFEHLVKEGEVLTGNAGRTFVVAGVALALPSGRVGLRSAREHADPSVHGGTDAAPTP